MKSYFRYNNTYIIDAHIVIVGLVRCLYILKSSLSKKIKTYNNQKGAIFENKVITSFSTLSLLIQEALIR